MAHWSLLGAIETFYDSFHLHVDGGYLWMLDLLFLVDLAARGV